MRVILLLLLAACDVYPSWRGEFSAGPVDPVNYPPPYLGVGGDRNRVGSGSFTEVAAYSQGNRIGYYSFPFSTAALASTPKDLDPLAITIDGKPNDALPTPMAYNFYNNRRCFTDGSHAYDPRTDALPNDQMDNVFTALPNATYSLTKATQWSYQPVVREIAVNASDLQCQSIKSEETMKATLEQMQPSGRYLAWALIDPGAAVYRVGQNINNSGGVGAQSWGWFNHYLVAYIDGGEIPTIEDVNAKGAPVKHMATQRLLYPRSAVVPKGATGPVLASGVPGALGAGYDVLEAPRSDDTLYSPVCSVFSYDTGAVTPIADLPKDTETILTNFEPTLRPATPPYIFCLQVAQ